MNLYRRLVERLVKDGWTREAAEHQARKAVRTADGRLQARYLLGEND